MSNELFSKIKSNVTPDKVNEIGVICEKYGCSINDFISELFEACIEKKEKNENGREDFSYLFALYDDKENNKRIKENVKFEHIKAAVILEGVAKTGKGKVKDKINEWQGLSDEKQKQISAFSSVPVIKQCINWAKGKAKYDDWGKKLKGISKELSLDSKKSKKENQDLEREKVPTLREKEPQREDMPKDKTLECVANEEITDAFCHALAEENNREKTHGLFKKHIEYYGYEELIKVSKIAMAEADTSLEEKIIDFIAYYSTEEKAVHPQFRLGGFISDVVGREINKQKSGFIERVCNRVSDYGHEGYRDLRRERSQNENVKKETAKDLCRKLGPAFCKLEEQLCNLVGSTLPSKEAVPVLMKQIKEIYAALELLGIVPVESVDAWNSQSGIPYNIQKHRMPHGMPVDTPLRKVKIASIGMRSIYDENVVEKALVFPDEER